MGIGIASPEDTQLLWDKYPGLRGMLTPNERPVLPSFNVPIPSINFSAPPVSQAPVSSTTFDPLLSPANILGQGQAAVTAAQAPLDVNKIVAPQLPLLTKQINDQLLTNKAAAQSDFMARGLTGSSSEVQTLTRDLPEQANRALAEGTVKLLTAAYPIAQAEKSAIVDATFKSASLTSQLRSMIGDEAFKKMSLDQQRELANQDTQLKLTLADAEMKFQASMKQAEFAFTHAENEADRAAAQQQFEYLKSERQKSRQDAFVKSLTSLAGLGIGLALAPATGGASAMFAYGAAGASAGSQFGGLFMLP